MNREFRILMAVAVLFIFLLTRPPLAGGQASSKNAKAGTVAAAVEQTEDVGEEEWPLFAWLEIVIFPKKASLKMVSAKHVQEAVVSVKGRGEHSLEDLRRLPVKTSDGRNVSLREVAKVDIWLARKDAKTANLAGVGCLRQKVNWRQI